MDYMSPLVRSVKELLLGPDGPTSVCTDPGADDTCCSDRGTGAGNVCTSDGSGENNNPCNQSGNG